MVAKVSIVWHSQTSEKVRQSVQWCLDQDGERVAGNFYRRLKKEVTRLSFAPYIGSYEFLLEDKRRFRSLFVRPYFKLIYYVDEVYSEIHIVDLWDTRRDPASLVENFMNDE